jgi:pimeloyl-ACP methyl ester carboxylesterase
MYRTCHAAWFGLLLMALPVAAEEPQALQPERVTFKTSDDVEIVGDYYAPPEGKGKAPCAVCVHMFPSDRHSWKPLIPALHERGFAVLAYDIRGAGESILPESKYLRRLYYDRDEKHFSGAYKDAEAALEWLGKQKRCDAGRVVMIGASVGCSISLDLAARQPEIAAVICLSPGKDYMSINSVQHIKQLGDRPVLLIAPEDEKSQPAPLARADKAAIVEIMPGEGDYHGTRMFDAPYGSKLIARIADFAAEHAAAGPAKEKKPKKKS